MATDEAPGADRIMQRTAIIFTVLMFASALFQADLVSSENAFAEGKTLERVPVGKNLRLGKGFDHSAYYGLFNSRDELAAIWFADHGAHASFVQSASLAENPGPGALMVSFQVWHSYFGSRKLNLWKTPAPPGKLSTAKSIFMAGGRREYAC